MRTSDEQDRIKPAKSEEMEHLLRILIENVKDYALKIPLVSLAGLNSILDFRAESTAEVKKLALEKIYDNSLLLEIQREITK